MTKFNLNGGVIWRRGYSTNLTPWDRLYEVASTHDSSGNVYLICRWYSDTINYGTLGLKVNSNGLVVISKYWPGLLSTYIDTKNFQFENNQLICTYNSSGIYSIPAFDIEPNPANKSCTVKYLSNDFTLIIVVDIYGNLILRKRFVQELILDGLNVGIYFITLENKMGRSTKKLVVTG